MVKIIALMTTVKAVVAEVNKKILMPLRKSR